MGVIRDNAAQQQDAPGSAPDTEAPSSPPPSADPFSQGYDLSEFEMDAGTINQVLSTVTAIGTLI